MKLGELIETRKRDLGVSYDKLVTRALSRGFDINRATLAAYAIRPMSEAPKTRTMEAIAAALGVSYREVVLAVTESLLGEAPIEVSNLQHVNSWLTLTSGRTDEQVTNLLRVVRTVSAAIDAEAKSSADEQAPRTSGSGDTNTGDPPTPIRGEPDLE